MYQSVRKWKSLCSISNEVNGAMNGCGNGKDTHRRTRSRTVSDSSVDIVVVDSDNEEDKRDTLADSNRERSELHGSSLLVLEQKIDRLSDMFLEQCRLLTALKADLRSSQRAVDRAEEAQPGMLGDLLGTTVFQSNNIIINNTVSCEDRESKSSGSLLDAIEARREHCIDREIRDLLTSFLQSDELKEHMVSATVESVRDVIEDCISRDLSALYLPMIEHSHRRLVTQVGKIIEDAFAELEQNSASLTRSVFRISRSLHRTLERHQRLLQAAARPDHNMDTFKHVVEELLHSELKQWRQKVVDVLTSAAESAEAAPEEPPSPPQPPSTDISIIDQLMIAAEINKQIEAGDVNGAFERALSAADLALVVAACRAAERSPRRPLRQHVLLALLQQLSTDVLHETQLKCRFLEDSIMNLDPHNPLTRSHLPLVIGEVRKHLSKFLATYPNHVASRRVALIIMAADNLLK